MNHCEAKIELEAALEHLQKLVDSDYVYLHISGGMLSNFSEAKTKLIRILWEITLADKRNII
jgi:hypothetical protein